jgi:hypothetical protein
LYKVTKKKLGQQVVHEQTMTFMKLSQKEQTPKQNAKKKVGTRKKRKAQKNEAAEEGDRKK